MAEGVELPEQQDALRALGCDLLQGYLFSRPLNRDDASAYLAGESATLAATSAGERST